MEQEKRNPVPERLRDFAKDQRSLSTRAEALFWSQVRAGRLSGHTFKRQVPITPYIVDFLCPSARLIVELDGEPHETAERRKRDATRDAWLRGQAFEIGRVSSMETTSPTLNWLDSSWALYFFDRRTVFLNSGWVKRRSTSTTTVLSFLSETTVPCKTRLGIVLTFRPCRPRSGGRWS